VRCRDLFEREGPQDASLLPEGVIPVPPPEAAPVTSQKCAAVPSGLVFKAHRLVYHSTLYLWTFSAARSTVFLARRNRARERSEWCTRPTEAGSFLRLIDSCITQLMAQGPFRTCNESKEEEEEPVSLPDTARRSALSAAGVRGSTSASRPGMMSRVEG